MKNVLALFLFTVLAFMHQPETLYDFNKSSPNEWYIVNDGVMGGLSKGQLSINEEGHVIFSGHVSLDNNGGFTSIRHRINKNIEGSSKIHLKLKGDGKRYQLRLKKNSSDYQSYIHYFSSSSEWETISMDLEDFYPSFRGRKLDMPNYEAGDLAELSILIANYKEEDFRIELDKIEVE